MAYRLESITRAATPQVCGICHRKHRIVVTFREITTVVPTDPTLPAKVIDTGVTLVTGSRCAYKVLESVPFAFAAAAKEKIDLANSF